MDATWEVGVEESREHERSEAKSLMWAFVTPPGSRLSVREMLHEGERQARMTLVVPVDGSPVVTAAPNVGYLSLAERLHGATAKVATASSLSPPAEKNLPGGLASRLRVQLEVERSLLWVVYGWFDEGEPVDPCPAADLAPDVQAAMVASVQEARHAKAAAARRRLLEAIEQFAITQEAVLPNLRTAVSIDDALAHDAPELPDPLDGRPWRVPPTSTFEESGDQ